MLPTSSRDAPMDLPFATQLTSPALSDVDDAALSVQPKVIMLGFAFAGQPSSVLALTETDDGLVSSGGAGEA